MQMSLPIRSFVLISMVFIVSACTTVSQRTADWQPEWPPVDYFEAQHQADPANAEVQAVDDYVKWVKRFYNGWAFYPDGWDWLTATVMKELDDYPQRLRMKEKMHGMGMRISAEWAKDGNHRVINSQHLLAWADAVKMSVQRNQEELLADKVSADIDLLLAGKLNPSVIRLVRYFPRSKADQDAEDEFASSDDF